MAKTFIKRTKDEKIIWYQLICIDDSESKEYQEAMKYAKSHNLNYLKRERLLYVQADGATPEMLKKHSCANLEGLYSYILRLKLKSQIKELIDDLNVFQVKSLWDLADKEEDRFVVDLCFQKMSELAK
jgi:hypothetical protein